MSGRARTSLPLPRACACARKLSLLALAAAVAALALAACGDGDGGGDDAASGPAAGSSPIAREGDLAARLRLDPVTPAPRDTIRVSVENLGERSLTFGLANRVERYAGGSWQDVSDRFGPDVVPHIALIVKPGESSGTGGAGALSDHVSVPAGAEPGIYRVVKNLSGPGGKSLIPTATFEIAPE